MKNDGEATARLTLLVRGEPLAAAERLAAGVAAFSGRSDGVAR